MWTVTGFYVTDYSSPSIAEVNAWRYNSTPLISRHGSVLS